MVITSTAPLVGILPSIGVFDLPFLFSNEREADQVLDGKAGDYFTDQADGRRARQPGLLGERLSQHDQLEAARSRRSKTSTA